MLPPDALGPQKLSGQATNTRGCTVILRLALLQTVPEITLFYLLQREIFQGMLHLWPGLKVGSEECKREGKELKIVYREETLSSAPPGFNQHSNFAISLRS